MPKVPMYQVTKELALNELSIRILYLLSRRANAGMTLALIAKILDKAYRTVHQNIYRVYAQFGYKPETQVERIEKAQIIWKKLSPEIENMIERGTVTVVDPYANQLEFDFDQTTDPR